MDLTKSRRVRIRTSGFGTRTSSGPRTTSLEIGRCTRGAFRTPPPPSDQPDHSTLRRRIWDLGFGTCAPGSPRDLGDARVAARRLDNRAARDRLKLMGRAALKARVRRHLRRAGRLVRVGLRPGPARRRHQPTEGLHRGRHGRVFLAAYALLLPVHRHAYEIVDGPCHVFFDLEQESLVEWCA